jgi:O-antigen/teichoic acid export membrane protein
MTKSSTALALVISQSVNFLLVFLFTPYLARTLPTSDYGTFCQLQLIASLFGVLTSAGLNQVAIYIYSNKNFNFNDAVKTIMVAAIVSGIIGMALMAFCGELFGAIFRNPSLQQLNWAFAPQIAGQQISAVLTHALVYTNQARFLLCLTACSTATRLILGIIALHAFDSLLWFVLVFALEPLASSFAQYCRLRLSGFMDGKATISIFWNAYHLAKPLYLVTLLGASYTYLSGLLISAWLTQADLATYKNGSIELPIIGTLYGVLSTAFVKDMSRLASSQDFKDLAALKKRLTSNTAAIVFPFAFYCIFFSHEFVLAYFSERYADSANVFSIFSFALLFRIQQYSDVLILLGASQIILRCNIAFIVANLFLNVSLIGPLGVQGCAIASVLSLGLLSWLQLHITIRQINAKYTEYLDLRKLFSIAFVCACMASCAKFTTHLLPLTSLSSLILGFGLFLPATLILLAKFAYLDLAPFRPIFLKLPYIGRAIENII